MAFQRVKATATSMLCNLDAHFCTNQRHPHVDARKNFRFQDFRYYKHWSHKTAIHLCRNFFTLSCQFSLLMQDNITFTKLPSISHHLHIPTLTMQVLALSPMKESLSTWVNLLARKGTWAPLCPNERIHSFKASRLLLISAPSIRVWRFALAVSFPLSLPIY